MTATAIGVGVVVRGVPSETKHNTLVTRIAFGSCANQSAPQVCTHSLLFYFLNFFLGFYCLWIFLLNCL